MNARQTCVASWRGRNGEAFAGEEKTFRKRRGDASSVADDSGRGKQLDRKRSSLGSSSEVCF